MGRWFIIDITAGHVAVSLVPALRAYFDHWPDNIECIASSSHSLDR